MPSSRERSIGSSLNASSCVRALCTFGLVTIFALATACEEAPTPTKVPGATGAKGSGPAVAVALSADEIKTSLEGALGGPGFMKKLSEINARIQALKTQQADAAKGAPGGEAKKAAPAATADAATALAELSDARDRVVLRVLLLATVTPKIFDFAKPLVPQGKSFEAAANGLLTRLLARDKGLASALKPWLDIVASLKDPGRPCVATAEALANWSREQGAVVTALRLYAAKLMADRLTAILSQPETGRYATFLTEFGPLLCPACGEAIGSANELPADFFLGAGNSMLFCPGVQDRAKALSPRSPENAMKLILEGCDARYYGFPSEELLRQVVGSSSIVLIRYLSAVHRLALVRRSPSKDGFQGKLYAGLQAFRDQFDARSFPLTLPYMTAALPPAAIVAAPAPDATTEPPPEAAPSIATFVSTQAGLPALSQEKNQPLLVMSLRADGIYVGTRPIVHVQRGSYTMWRPELAWPGKKVADYEALLAIVKEGAKAKRWPVVATTETKESASAEAAPAKVAPVVKAAPEAEPAEGSAWTPKGGFVAIADALLVQKKAVAAVSKRFHASLAVPGAFRDDRVLVVIEENADKRLLPGIFAALTDAGFLTPEFVLGESHTPWSVPVLIAGTKPAEDAAASLSLTHKSPLLVIADRKDTVAVYPPGDRKAGAEAWARAPLPTGTENPAPQGMRRIADPKKVLFRGEFDATAPTFAERFPAAVAWIQEQSQATPMIRLGAVTGGDLRLLPGLAAACAHQSELRPATPGEAVLRAAKAFTGDAKGLSCPQGSECHGAFVTFDPKPSLPQMAKAKGKVTESRPAGFCAKENINKIVTRRTGAFKFCYEKELQTYPDLQGKITMKWTIEENGAVSGANVVADTMKNKRVTKCLKHTIGKLKFDKPQGGVCVVRWPFVFKP